MNRNFEMFPNLKQCNAILSESGKKKAINDNRISFNAMYIVTGCSETSSIPFKNKTHDTIMVGNLHSRLRKNDRFFQDRRDICDYRIHEQDSMLEVIVMVPVVSSIHF